ncbi:MAG: site-2 protease family protein [Acidobacteriota bacterium]
MSKGPFDGPGPQPTTGERPGPADGPRQVWAPVRPAADSGARPAPGAEPSGGAGDGWPGGGWPGHPPVIEVRPAAPPPREPSLRLPMLLFVLTCLSTIVTGGPLYGVAVMIILLSHELGHYLQARRYRVPASLPYFLPLPVISPFGTLGAVIGMRPRTATGRGLFDIAISGPIAGLVPTLIFAVIGLRQSEFVPNAELPEGPSYVFGEPLLFEWLSQLVLGPSPPDHTLMIGSLAFAAWVGIFITALNLLPIGQLDGGHILYTLAPRSAHTIGLGLFGVAFGYVILQGLWHWSLLIGLLMLMGFRHPPAIDSPPFQLGAARRVLGWLLLLFVIVGLTPTPIDITGV